MNAVAETFGACQRGEHEACRHVWTERKSEIKHFCDCRCHEGRSATSEPSEDE